MAAVEVVRVVGKQVRCSVINESGCTCEVIIAERGSERNAWFENYC
jgi:hypothetical protein